MVILVLTPWINGLIFHSVAAASFASAISYPNCSITDPALIFVHGKSALDGLGPCKPTPTWENERRLLTVGLRQASALAFMSTW